ncbi:MAG: VWA domain-containing protein [Deltaproteobacteria bacterium]|nr:VWA domain-containing protein [Nannocystaceae bacterium]
MGPSNCDELQCTAHGHCELDNNNVPGCACDFGYEPGGDGVTCQVDQGCVQVRYLEDRCRQLINDAPAVALFFAVDFCAGTAVTPELREELGLEFKVSENKQDIADNVESYSTIIDKDVESYVTLVVDVSDSVTMSQDLPALVEELRGFVGTLAPGVDEPDVYVSIYVFGRSVAEYVPFTRDLATVDSALAAIAADPAPVVLLAGNGDGTDLYDAVEIGIDRTQRIRDLRDAVTWGGVLTAGTVVIVTDGNDESNGSLDQAQIDQTINNVISIGISDAVDDETLQAIGRDGSFLAPTPADWTAAFAEIAERVDQYPDRSYLLAYCSSATEGSPSVEVTVEGINVRVTSKAACDFNADVFSSNALDVCDAAFFAVECGGSECGGLTACGACSDDACCNGGNCVAPMNAGEAGISCIDQPELCAATDEVCNTENPEFGYCQPPAAYNDGTCVPDCDPGVTYCSADEDGECIYVRAPGDVCDAPEQCPDLNCSRTNEDNPIEARICQGPAQLHDFCGSDEAVCEQGGHCTGGACRPKLLNAESCSGDETCRSGRCQEVGEAGNRCVPTGACFWSWDEKVPS